MIGGNPTGTETELDGVETGSFVRSPFDADELRSLVVASFNMRYAVGSRLISGGLLRRLGLTSRANRAAIINRNLQRTAKTFSANQRMPLPHILALQEADKSTTRTAGIHVARELAKQLEMHYSHVGMKLPRGVPPKRPKWYFDFEEYIDLHDPGDTGVAVLSRLPFGQVSRIDLPWSECPWRPRQSMHTEIAVQGRTLHLLNTHVDLHASVDNQLAQHDVVLDFAAKLDGPIVLLGDFNTFGRRACDAIRRHIESRGFRSPFPTGTGTWRTGPIRLHTDWIFIRGIEANAHGISRGLNASDHWPIWVGLDLKTMP